MFKSFKEFLIEQDIIKESECNLNEEQLFILKAYNKEWNYIEYYAGDGRMSDEIDNAKPLPKSEWVNVSVYEKLKNATYNKKVSWGYDKVPKYKLTLVKYVPNMKDLVPVYYEKEGHDGELTLTQVKKHFKDNGVKILMTDKKRYYGYGHDKYNYEILYILPSDVEKIEKILPNLNNNCEIGFAEPDRKTRPSSKLKL